MNERSYSWGHSRRFNDFSNHFKRKFSNRVQKVSIDAGFTCPNRDGTKGVGGCVYCNNSTFKPSYCNLKHSVKDQITEGVAFFSKKYPEMEYLAYFQAYTNTYAPLENLRSLYEEALAHPKVIGLVIATRPDTLPVDVLDFLEQLNRKYYVMVEIGVESCNDEVLKRINRGHKFDETISAVEELSKRGIHSCAHMILGLPGESRQEILNQARELSQLPIENIKLHQLQVHKNTVMEKQFELNPQDFNLFDTYEEYIDIVIKYMEILNPNIIIERFVSQSPKDKLIAPKWGLKNFEFVAKLEKELKKRDTWQGRLFEQ